MNAFEILGDPVRRRIVELLADGEIPAGAVTEVIGTEFGISQPAVSAQLRVLREAGFAAVRPQGARRLYAIRPDAFDEVDAWLTTNRRRWTQSLDALDTEIARGRSRREQGGKP
ncbi:ArsR/SmtB family transcription factor [Leekyejoonella antrihumi]|uniref:Winged helix-turn-helix transcriptional regulator n=1 Tax=Leekyejoonella antrihumi TaxID=1660198 RepID=A0A563E1Y0_9MICO|nr:metalloregulator ArsR/SmtB family transcription factor [Leekyejoonella antrihumi]TWP36243.1 winged helix-turn-helix transcriptional regulator [Leekyejoonella antrihumi]